MRRAGGGVAGGIGGGVGARTAARTGTATEAAPEVTPERRRPRSRRRPSPLRPGAGGIGRPDRLPDRRPPPGSGAAARGSVDRGSRGGHPDPAGHAARDRVRGVRALRRRRLRPRPRAGHRQGRRHRPRAAARRAPAVRSERSAGARPVPGRAARRGAEGSGRRCRGAEPGPGHAIERPVASNAMPTSAARDNAARFAARLPSRVIRPAVEGATLVGASTSKSAPREGDAAAKGAAPDPSGRRTSTARTTPARSSAEPKSANWTAAMLVALLGLVVFAGVQLIGDGGSKTTPAAAPAAPAPKPAAPKPAPPAGRPRRRASRSGSPRSARTAG